MKQAFYIDFDCYSDPNAPIIPESVLLAAERGENYINPAPYVFHGEFFSPEEARQAHYAELAEAAHSDDFMIIGPTF